MKVLVLCNTIQEYIKFIQDSGLNPNTSRPIYKYEDILGYNEPTKYVALSLPKNFLAISYYMTQHGITPYRESS